MPRVVLAGEEPDMENAAAAHPKKKMERRGRGEDGASLFSAPSLCVPYAACLTPNISRIFPT